MRTTITLDERLIAQLDALVLRTRTKLSRFSTPVRSLRPEVREGAHWGAPLENESNRCSKGDDLRASGRSAGGAAMRMLGMGQVDVVRDNVLTEGRTQRAVARELGLSRVTVKRP